MAYSVMAAVMTYLCFNAARCFMTVLNVTAIIMIISRPVCPTEVSSPFETR